MLRAPDVAGAAIVLKPCSLSSPGGLKALHNTLLSTKTDIVYLTYNLLMQRDRPQHQANSFTSSSLSKSLLNILRTPNYCTLNADLTKTTGRIVTSLIYISAVVVAECG